jgi:cytochrome c biogenesis protein CcmG/thiol:disulfide interchange protein DsbE
MSDTDVRPDTAPEPDAGAGAVVAARPRRVAPFVALAVALVLGGLFVVLAVNNPGSPDVAEPYLLNRPAPRVVSTTLDGDPFDLSRRKGSWVVLNFFDPTCVPCVQEHPELIKLFEQQLTITDGAELYTIVNRGSDESVQAFFDENGGDWPVVRDPDGQASVDFGVAQVPETWIVDPDGIVRVRYPGRVSAEQVATQLQALREARAA